jgi:hypothetical protein
MRTPIRLRRLFGQNALAPYWSGQQVLASHWLEESQLFNHALEQWPKGAFSPGLKTTDHA